MSQSSSSPSLNSSLPPLEGRERFDLKVLDDMYDMFVKKKKDAADRRIDETALPMIGFIDGRWKLTAHESITNSDEALGMALAAAIKATGDPVDVYKIKSSYTYIDKEGAEKFFYGLALGADDTQPTRLDKSKRGIELGRAVAYAMRAHGEFQQNNQNLGLAALKRDQYFFGNNFGETDTKRGLKIVFGLKAIFKSNFEDPRIGEAYYEVLSKLLHRAGLSNHNDEEYNHAMDLLLIQFDEFIVRYNRPVTTQKLSRGKSKITHRRPNKPARSPLFMKPESKLLQELLTPVWENLDNFKRNWVSLIKNWGFADVSAKVSEIMNLRWTILESYSRITTSRLNEARSIDMNASKSKKSDITANTVYKFLLNRKNLCDSFVMELISIIPSKSLTSVIAEGLLKGKTTPLTEEQCYKVLYARAFDMYQKAGHFENIGAQPEKVDIPSELAIAQTFNTLRQQCSRVEQAKLYWVSLGQHKNNITLMATAKMLVAMKDNLIRFNTEIKSLDEIVLNAVFNIVRDSYPITVKTTYLDFIRISNKLIDAIERLAKISLENSDALQKKILDALGEKPW